MVPSFIPLSWVLHLFELKCSILSSLALNFDAWDKESYSCLVLPLGFQIARNNELLWLIANSFITNLVHHISAHVYHLLLYLRSTSHHCGDFMCTFGVYSRYTISSKFLKWEPSYPRLKLKINNKNHSRQHRQILST